MDLRTGLTYETREEALAAGVPESDIAEVTVIRDREYWLKFANPKHPEPHQNTRETQRRMRQLARTAAAK